MKCPVLGHFQRFEIIQALCRLPYLVVDRFQKAQYLVVIFHLFHHFYDYLRAGSGFLVAKLSFIIQPLFRQKYM